MTDTIIGLTDTIISVVMVAAMVLLGGAYSQFRKGDQRKALLMGVLAFVMLANVAIWLTPVKKPVSDGEAAVEGSAIAE